MPIPSGLYVWPDKITSQQESEIIAYLDSQPWSNELSRRTQHYGTEYDYVRRNLKPKPAPPLSGPILNIANWLKQYNYMNPVQCIVNEYTRSQGIAPHIDREVFGDRVIGLSIGADVMMEFTRGDEIYNAWLPRRSLMVMSGESRSSWKHSIPKRVTYIDPNGTKITKPQDYRRISLTYREII